MDTLDSFSDHEAIAYRMEVIGDGAQDSIPLQLLGGEIDSDDESGDFNDAVAFNAAVMDEMTQGVAVPFSLMRMKEGGTEYESKDEGIQILMYGAGDVAQTSTSFPSLTSSEEEEDLVGQSAYTQATREPSNFHTVSSPKVLLASGQNVQEGVQLGITNSIHSLPAPSFSESLNDIPMNATSCVQNDSSKDGGPVSFSTLPPAIIQRADEGSPLAVSAAMQMGLQPPPAEIKVETNELQFADLPFSETEEDISGPSDLARDDNANFTTWSGNPQGRGKAVVRRGRPRPWTSEDREAAQKRVKLDELYGDASPSVDLQELSHRPPASSCLENPSSKEESGRFLTVDETHKTVLLAPESLAQRGTEDTRTEVPGAAIFEKIQDGTPIKAIVNNLSVGPQVGDQTGTTLKGIERNTSMNRCGGITLQGNQCAHSVRDGSGFCVKHTNHAMPNGSQEFSHRPPASSPLENPSSQEGSGRFLTVDEMHKTAILAPESLAQRGTEDTRIEVPGAAIFEKIQDGTPIKTIVDNLSVGPQVGDQTGTTLKVIERNTSMNRCGGITLQGNQCAHSVRDGSGFCVKHTNHAMPNGEGTSAIVTRGALKAPYKPPDLIVFRCRGKTLHGAQCTHSVRDGSVYCLKHADQAWGAPIKRTEHKPVQAFPETGVLNGAHAQIQTPTLWNPSIASSSLKEKVEIGDPRCVGRTRRTEEQCSFRPKAGSMFCERHLRQFREQGNVHYMIHEPSPVSTGPTLKRRKSQEGMYLLDKNSVRERRSQSRAKELFNGILSAGLLNGKAVGANRKDLVGWICEEATKDTVSGAALLGLLSEEKERLRKVLIEDSQRLSKTKPSDFWSSNYSQKATENMGPGLKKNCVCTVQCSFQPKTGSVFCERHKRQFREQRNVGYMIHESSPESIGPTLKRNCVASVLKHVQGECLQCEEGGVLMTSDTACPLTNLNRLSALGSSQVDELETDILTCSLCQTKFPDIALLGKHWKEDHKKEAFLFQKGLACRECGQEYTNRGGLLRHWKSNHPTLPMVDGTVLCIMCDKKFSEFSILWTHVESEHSLELSRSDFARQVNGGIPGGKVMLNCSLCGDKFDTHWDLQHHKESAHIGQVGKESKLSIEVPGIDSRMTASTNVNGGSPHKFKCRFCGERFNLLPDLGRHHQAEHRKPTNLPTGKIEVCPTVQSKTPPVGKRMFLPNPETANSSPGKMLPLSELCTTLPPKIISGNTDVVMTVEWPPPEPEGEGSQPQAVNFRQWKTIARERGKSVTSPVTTSTPIATPTATLTAAPTAATLTATPTAAPTAATLTATPTAAPTADTPTAAPKAAPKKRRRRRKRMEHLQNEKLVPLKNKQGGAKRIAQHMKAVKQIQQERHGLNGCVQATTYSMNVVNSVSKMQPQRSVNTTDWPMSADLLDAAQVACCKDSLYRELSKKHNYLHPNLHLQAVSLCDAMRVSTPWQIDGFVCPNKCPPFHVIQAPPPALEVDMAGFSDAPFQAQANLAYGPGWTPLQTVDIKEVIKGKHIVMCEDLSNGQEPVPVPCVVDEDILRPCTCSSCRESPGNSALDSTEPWKAFSYINKRLLDPLLGLDTESSKLGCACGEGRCNPLCCDHVSMFDNDNMEARDKSGVPMKGRFPYDDQGHIILEDGYMVYECNSSCLCEDDCQNRVLQKGVQVKLEVFKSRHKGWAVRSAEPIASGTFICEYIGEVLNDKEANKRGERYDKDGCSYLYDIDAHLDVTGSRAAVKPFVIDATKHGNVARFINHSCAPNLVNYEVLVESMDCQLAHIGFFANRDIAAGEELAYNYRYKLLPGKGCACHCGAATCRGRLY